MGTKTADPAAFANGQRLTFVVLATTDLHANLRSYNYYLDAEGGDPGLARVASVVRKLRAEAGNCLLLDNGDTLQGSPLGDLAAEGGLGRPHPMIAAMNALGYDAGTPDGIMGAATTQAVRDYQSANKLPVTGTVTSQLIDALNAGATPEY